MYRAGQYPDHVQRSHVKSIRSKYIEPIPKVFTWVDLVQLLFKVLAAGVFFFAVCMFMAMCVRMK